MAIEINFKPSPKQYQCMEYLLPSSITGSDSDSIDVVFYGGAAGGGKSYTACYWLTTMAMTYAGTTYGLCRKELSTLKLTTLKTLFKVLDECGLKADKDYRYNKVDKTITFNNGSIIMLLDLAYRPSDEEYSKLGGLELTGAFIDEAGEVPQKAFDIILSRINRNNHKHNIPAKLLIASNPTKNFIYTDIYKPWKEDKLPNNWRFIPATVDDNPSEEGKRYRKHLLSLRDEVQIRRLLYGDWEYEINNGGLLDYGQIINLFNPHDKKVENTPSTQRFISCDIALEGSDKFVICVWFGLILVDVITLDKCNADEALKCIKDAQFKYKVPTSNIVYDYDGVGQFLKPKLPGAYAFVNRTPLNGENYSNLKSQCAFKFIEYVRDDKIYFHTKAHRDEIISDLEQLRRQDGEKVGIESKKDLKRRIGRSPDFSDAILYRMVFELKSAPNMTHIRGV